MAAFGGAGAPGSTAESLGISAVSSMRRAAWGEALTGMWRQMVGLPSAGGA